MKFRSLLVMVVVASTHCAGLCKTPLTPPSGFGQLEQPPTLFPGGRDASGRQYQLYGQPERNGKLVLTASNGFFSEKVCRARGNSTLPKIGDEELIEPNYAYLDEWKSTDGTIRWHVWLPRPGVVHFAVHMTVSKNQAGSRIRATFAGGNKTRRTNVSNDKTPQRWKLSFRAANAGEHVFTLSASEIKDARLGVGRVHTVDAFGPAISGAKLLRARWRPAAVHGAYSSTTLSNGRAWVISTRNVRNSANFSPITTPFGYFGGTFTDERRATGSFSFSMWAMGRNQELPPLEQMPHLLAVGSPTAEFGGFGHEGTGVTVRNWVAMPDFPEVVVQALRVEVTAEYFTFYGYFWDHPSQAWKLYAVGREPSDTRLRRLWAGSFCEIPGPPTVQRTGDKVREVRRYGWQMDSRRRWHVFDKFTFTSKRAENKQWITTPQGEYAMATGGMRFYRNAPAAAGGFPGPTPAYLSATATAQLFDLPVKFGNSTVRNATRTTANVDVSVTDAGPNARGILYFGEIDCLSFAPRAGNAPEQGAGGRAWQRSIGVQEVNNGSNIVQLTGLQPGTTYYYRMLVINDNGKMWDFSSHQFQTAP